MQILIKNNIYKKNMTKYFEMHDIYKQIYIKLNKYIYYKLIIEPKN